LVDPGFRALLQSVNPDLVFVSATYHDQTPVAVATTLVDPRRRSAELLCTGELPGWHSTTALTKALGHTRRTLCGAGFRIRFDPTTAPKQPVIVALQHAGFRPARAAWRWFQADEAALRAVVAARGTQLPRFTSLAKATPTQLEQLGRDAFYHPHPWDLNGISPVLLDPDDQVAAVLVLRRASGATALQWLWVAPEHRRTGLALATWAAALELAGPGGPPTPLIARVRATNQAAIALAEGRMAKCGVTRHLPTTQGWEAGPNVGDPVD
jgi:GNAT superfamily N-acetyltransferase